MEGAQTGSTELMRSIVAPYDSSIDGPLRRLCEDIIDRGRASGETPGMLDLFRAALGTSGDGLTRQRGRIGAVWAVNRILPALLLATEDSRVVDLAAELQEADIEDPAVAERLASLPWPVIGPDDRNRPSEVIHGLYDTGLKGATELAEGYFRPESQRISTAAEVNIDEFFGVLDRRHILIPVEDRPAKAAFDHLEMGLLQETVADRHDAGQLR